MDNSREGFIASRTTTTVSYRETIGIPVETHEVYIAQISSPPPPPRRRTITRRICACVIPIAIISSITYAFIWAIVQPQMPDFEINTISMPLSTDESSLPTWEITFKVRNPNKRMKLAYDVMQTSLSYSDGYYTEKPLCQTDVSGFSQGTKNTMFVSAKFDYVQESSVSYVKEKLSYGTVNLKVEMFGGVLMKPNLYMASQQLKVTCVDVKVGFTDSDGLVGSLLDGSKKCKVDRSDADAN